MPNTHKLYCYIDETGQDTRGRFFIVAVVVTDERRNELVALLEHIEQISGKHKRKWLKTRQAERDAYCNQLLSVKFPGQIFTSIYRHDGPYQDLQVLTAAKALNLYRQAHAIDDNYKVTIAIDGLTRTSALKAGRVFRLLGIKARKTIGERDESSPIIRLADAIAGLVRESHEGRPGYLALQKSFESKKILQRL